MNPHQVTRDFEAELCRYTGAKYAVAVNSCTSALLLACAWCIRPYNPDRDGDVPEHMARAEIEIPKRTYVSVPCSIIHAGATVSFRDEDWVGYYQLKPYPVFDSARWFTSQLFPAVTRASTGAISPAFVCVSFHVSKTLGDSQGGAILHDCDEADAWFRRMRFDGRTEGVPPNQDDFREIGYHCYLSPDVATRLLWKLSVLPQYNAPLANDAYPGLDKFEVFR